MRDHGWQQLGLKRFTRVCTVLVVGINNIPVTQNDTLKLLRRLHRGSQTLLYNIVQQY